MPRTKPRDTWSAEEHFEYARSGTEPLIDADAESIAKAVAAAAERSGFADPEDAVIAIEAKLRRGTLDAALVIDDNGNVEPYAIADQIEQLLERKPHYRSDLEAMSPADWAQMKYGDHGDEELQDVLADRDVEHMSVEQHAIRKYGKA